MPRVSHAAPPRDAARRAVARDTATILLGVAFALTLAQVAGLTSTGAADPSQPDPGSEEVVGVASGRPVVTLAPLDTLGAIVNASAGLDATPTPIPIITLGPPAPSPSASPVETAGASAKPTPKPSVKPSVKPSTSVPPPPLVVDFTCDQPVGSYSAAVAVNCSAVVTGSVGTVTYAWKVDGSPAGAGSGVSPVFDTNGDHSISLSITDGLGRSAGPASKCCWSVTISLPSPT